MILNKARDKERRNWMRRLIEHGAILENAFPMRGMDGGELPAFLNGDFPSARRFQNA